VGVVRCLGQVLDPAQFLLMLRVGSPVPAPQVGVEPTAAHAQQASKQVHRVGLPLLGDELKPQLNAFAKKAVAPFLNVPLQLQATILLAQPPQLLALGGELAVAAKRLALI